MWRSQAARTAWKQKLLQRWQELDLDLLITPGLVTPAFRLGVGANINAACSPTFIWNWLDFPAASCPITLVTEHDLATPRRVTEATSKRCAAEVLVGLMMHALDDIARRQPQTRATHQMIHPIYASVPDSRVPRLRV